MTRGSGASPACVVSVLRTPPASSTRRSAARRAAAGPTAGSTPRSNRFAASLGSLCRRCRPRDRHGVEMGGLEDDLARRIGDLQLCRAHDAGEADDSAALCAVAGIGDEEVLRVECPRRVVQRHERLPRSRPAHGEGRRELLRVIRVERLAELKHHVVRDVHREADRPHPGLEQAAGHPERGARRRVDARDGERGEAAAPGFSVDRRRVVQDDGEAPVRRRIRRDVCGVRERLVLEHRVLACDPAHAQLIAAVRSHVDVEGHPVESQQRDRVVSGRPVESELGQHDDAVVVIAQPQFPG